MWPSGFQAPCGPHLCSALSTLAQFPCRGRGGCCVSHLHLSSLGVNCFLSVLSSSVVNSLLPCCCLLSSFCFSLCNTGFSFVLDLSYAHTIISTFETCFKFLLLKALVSNLMTLKSNGVKLTLRKSS